MTVLPRTDKLALSAIALFLDVDGTLLEIAPAPHAVSVPSDLRERLRALFVAGGGAVALVSGRAITDLDALFAPLALPAAGLHGFEHRGASGVYRRRPLPSAAALESARGAMLELAGRHRGVLVEDKQFALALHFRGAPQLEETAVAAMQEVVAQVGGELELQRGKMVVELRPAGATKAQAVAAFLAEAPFAGRLPIFVGDDLTDESAFELVNRHDGLSVVVDSARPSAARARLADVAAVWGWLAQLHAEPAEALRRLTDAKQGAVGAEDPARSAPRSARPWTQA